MPFYHDSVFGPSESSQLPPPTSVLTSPMDDRPRPALRRTSLPPPDPDHDDDDRNDDRHNSSSSSHRPFRVPREVLSPAPSPIPISPTYYSYRNDDDDEEGEGEERGTAGVHERGGDGEEEVVVEADELELAEVRRTARVDRKQQGRAARHGGDGGATTQASEKYVSIPRNGGHAVAASDSDDGKEDDDSDGRAVTQRADKRGRRHAGLVSSRPRSSPQRKKVPAKPSAAAPPRASTRATDYAQDEEEEGREEEADQDDAVLRRPSRTTRHTSAHRTYSRSRHHRHRGDSSRSSSGSDADADTPPPPPPQRGRHDGTPKPVPARQRRPLRPTAEMRCPRCGFALPSELAAYLDETSAFASVPQPHCPACGSRLGDAVEERDADDYDAGPQRRGGARHTTAAPASAPPRRSPLRRRAEEDEEEVNLYSDAEGGSETPRYHRARPTTATAAAQPDSARRYVSPSTQQQTTMTTMLVPKSPYLTLDFMPRTLASTMKKTPTAQQRNIHAAAAPADADDGSGSRGKTLPMDLEHTGVPWATRGCAACCWQRGVSLAGVCCCCAMPCVLFRERQQLLFHELESRYICCAGAFPCCVPPASLRPELYYTVQAAPRRVRQSNYWGDAVEVSQDGGYDGGEGRFAGPAASLPPRGAAFRSATGIASPSSLVNPRTGLPLEGCYHNTAAAAGGGGGGCCDCVSCVHHTCVWDCSKGCCLACTHPTAHCLACPLCCLCCELTCCMPCALWANRLLIRQHYNLAPDPAVDAGAACCYSCCLTCCTCQAVSVVSRHHAAAQQQQQQRGSRARSTADVAASSSLSCWSQLAVSVAACLASVCCLCPCAACSLAQQRDQRERLGYPLVVDIPPTMEML